MKTFAAVFYLFSFCIVFTLGCYLRWGGIFQQVTYVDELLLLTQGDPIFTTDKTSPESLPTYVYKTAISRGNSYAPFNTLLARLINGPKMFSIRALLLFRLISFAFSIGSLILFAHLSLLRGKKQNKGSTLLLFTVFACQAIQWFNAKQGHSYSAGVFGVLLGLELIQWLLVKPSRLRITVILLSLIALTTFQYQMLVFNLAVGIVLAASPTVYNSNFANKNQSFFRLITSGFLVVTLFLLAVVAHLKGHMMTPQWIISYMNVGWPNFRNIGAFFCNLFHVFKLSNVFYVGGENLLFGIAAAILFCLGLIEIFKKKNKMESVEWILYRVLVVFLGLWFSAYWMGKTPISPTRHCIIYLVPILFIQLKGLSWLDSFFSMRTANGLLIVCSLFVAGCAYSNFEQYLVASHQVATRSKIEKVASQYSVQKIVTWAFDYSTLRLILDSPDQKLSQNFAWYGHIDSLPSERMLLVELSSSGEIVSSPLDKFSKKFKMSQLFFERNEYDFEASADVSYGCNLLKIWLLEPVTSS